MEEQKRRQWALFRFAVIAPLVSQPLTRGRLQDQLRQLAKEVYVDPKGCHRRFSSRTLEDWYYRHLQGGVESLAPQPRSDAGKTLALPTELQLLVLDMKREDPGRSAALILRELLGAGRLKEGEVSLSTIQRLLKREGLQAPKGQATHRRERLRWEAAECGELWQGDCLHGPKLFDPRSGRLIRVKIFGLLDDKSRMVVGLHADFSETQAYFLRVLHGSVLRRGLPNSLYLDNHGSFTGSDVQWACAKLNIRLLHARPYDGAAKGKIERFWRTLRSGCLGRLDPEKVLSLDDLNLRLASWLQAEYHQRPHAGLNGATPLEVWERGAEQIRWVEDPSVVESSFVAILQRKVRNDGTCQLLGKCYEVPSHLRRQTISIHYGLLHPDRFWVMDGVARVMLCEVKPRENAQFKRRTRIPRSKPTRPVTGLNPIEDLLGRIIGTEEGKNNEGTQDQGKEQPQ